MESRSRLTTSIVAATLGHYVVQVALFAAAAFTSGVPSARLAEFAGVSGAVHLGFGSFLVVMRGDFVRVATGERLQIINAANTLTMFRISSVPTILYLVFLSKDYPTVSWLIGITALSFVTDFVDGQISRRRNEITKIGRYLDSSSDYVILTAAAIAFTFFGLVSRWFFWLLMVRLAFQFVGMAALFVYQGGSVEPRSSFLGKASVFAAMFVCALSLLKLVEAIVETMTLITAIAEFMASSILVVSIGDKAVLLLRDFRDARARKQRDR